MTAKGKRKRLSEQIQAQAAEADTLRAIRKAENVANKAIAELKISEAKRKQAENEAHLAALRYEFLNDLGDEKPELVFKPRTIKHGGKATAIAVLTDWHYEERVDPRTINGLNEYSPAIARQRVKAVFERIVVMLDAERSLSNIRDLVLALLGDFITGYIHDELKEGNYMSPLEASLEVEELLCAGIDYLLKHADVKTITVPTAFGNHARLTKKMGAATAAQNSLEWLMYNHLARYYRHEPRIQWKIERGYHNIVDVQGKRVRFHHGDAIRFNGGVGGVSIPTNKKIAKWDLGGHADLDVFGHWHQHETSSKFIICNCLIGYNAYAQKELGAPFSDPAQTLIVIDRDRPKPVSVKEIFCGNARNASAM